ncbi:MAG: hypothetical protein ACC645_02050 [Pirellulales bacterium]
MSVGVAHADPHSAIFRYRTQTTLKHHQSYDPTDPVAPSIGHETTVRDDRRRWYDRRMVITVVVAFERRPPHIEARLDILARSYLLFVVFSLSVVSDLLATFNFCVV